MADISIEKGRDGVDLTWAWALAAIVAIGALMLWLLLNRPSETAVVTDSATSEVVETQAAETIDLAVLATSPEQYVGRTVRVNDVPVTAMLGARAYWTQPPNTSPFLIAITPEVSDVTWLTEGATATLEGVVQQASVAELDRLLAEGALVPEGRSMAEFATHFLSVNRVNP